MVGIGDPYHRWAQALSDDKWCEFLAGTAMRGHTAPLLPMCRGPAHSASIRPSVLTFFDAKDAARSREGGCLPRNRNGVSPVEVRSRRCDD